LNRGGRDLDARVRQSSGLVLAGLVMIGAAALLLFTVR